MNIFKPQFRLSLRPLPGLFLSAEGTLGYSPDVSESVSFSDDVLENEKRCGFFFFLTSKSELDNTSLVFAFETFFSAIPKLPAIKN